MNIFKSYNHIQHGETPPRERQKAQHIRTGIRRKRQSHPLYGNPPLRKEAGTCSCSRSHSPSKRRRAEMAFPLAILIPACASSSPAFHMTYSAYKLNKQGDNIHS